MLAKEPIQHIWAQTYDYGELHHSIPQTFRRADVEDSHPPSPAPAPRNCANPLNTVFGAFSTLDELKAVVQGWPANPNCTRPDNSAV